MNHDLWPLARQGIRRRRRSSILLFLVLTLSFAFAVMMLSVMGSMNRTNIEYLKNTYGAWHGAIPDGKDSDRAFLERRDWLDRLGESVNYGQVRGTTPVSGVGSVDETFLELGRIRLDEGRLPEQPGEIAMEADLLVALGYEPAVGQTVSVPMMIPQAEDPTSFLLVVRDFVLTGVLHEYAHLWILENNVQNRLLNSALILPEDGEAILAEAQAMADEYQSGLVRPPLTSYFYTPLEGMEERLRAEVDAHMAETRGAAEDRRGCVNVSAGAAYAATDYNTFYVGLILVIALLAVVAVYLLELQSDVRRVVRLRSIGASKTQIRRLLLLETVLLAVPAVALGTALGAAGTVGLLRLLVFSGSVEIVVDIPWSAVAAALALWIFGVGLMRLLTFQLAVRTPMTGRMVLETKQRRRVHKLQRVFAWGLSMALCLVATYSILEYQLPWVLYTYYSGQHAYSVYRTESSPLFAAGEVPGVMTAEETELLLEIPGVTGQMGITCLSCRLRGETVEEQDAQVYVVDAAQWMERNGAPFFDGVDLDAYRRGELAVLVVAVQQDGTAYFTTEIQEKNAEGETVYSYETTEAEVTAAAGDTLELALAAVLREEADGGESMQAQTLQIPTVVGAVAEYEVAGTGQNFGLPFGLNCLYSVLVSPGYIQRVLDTLPEGSQLGHYQAGGRMGFEELYLFADANAEYLFTDNAVAQLARRYQLGIGIFRTMYAADIQGYLQTMLTLAGTGVCVGLIAALLLLSTLELEAQRERRRYGILRALGMSRRQQNLALARQAALQAVTAIAVSCGVYVIFGVRDAVLVYQRNEEAVPALLQLLVWQLENLRYTWFLPLLLLGEFLLVVALYFAAKGRLYKLNLMEMLSQER